MMKLTPFAKYFTLLLATGAAGQALAAAPADSWYAGVKAGWSDYYNADIGHHTSPEADDQTGYTLHGSNAAGGAFFGYQAMDWLAVEGGYDYLGNASVTSNNAYGTRLESQGIQLSVKMSLPLTDSWDLYARGGMMGWMSQVKSGGQTNTDNGVSPLAALGTEVALSDSLAMRLEYQYTGNVGNGGDNGIEADNGQTSLGVVYRFGQDTPPPPAPEPTPVQVVPPQHISLSTTVHFDTGSAALSDREKQALDAWSRDMNDQHLAQRQMIVTGYADRTGQAQANQQLSEDRAHQVADYLRRLPDNALPVSISGKGTDNPVTGDDCTAGSRETLSVCLAPDRRVDVVVQGLNTPPTHVKSGETL